MQKPEIQVVIGVIKNGNKVVCVRQAEEKNTNESINGKDKRDFLLGLWHLPGGKAQEKETLEQAMIREAKEEAGIIIKVIKLLGQRREEREKAWLNIFWFLCETSDEKLIAGDDATEAEFIDISQVMQKCDPKVVAQWPKEVLEIFDL